jgi:nitroreductase
MSNTQTQIVFPVNPNLTLSNNIPAYPVMDTIQQRKSIRAFASTPVAQETINSLFEAARWSFSASNDQPWVYLWATPNQTALWDGLLSTLAEPNRIWASHAQLLILSLSRTHSLKTEKPIYYHLHDVGAANMAMNLQAVSMGMQLHPMAGFNKQQAIDTLNIPESLVPVAIFAGGYAGTDLTALNDLQQHMESKKIDRIPQEGFVVNKSF